MSTTIQPTVDHTPVMVEEVLQALAVQPGGRYVDCKLPTEGNTIMIDFNKSYNPYCAYNPKYSCVIPPDENRLSVRIEAGEKKYDESH